MSTLKERIQRDLPNIFVLGLVAFLSAWGASKFTISGQQELYKEHAAALKDVIRFEVAQNLGTLERSTVKLRGVASDLEAFIAGNAPAPTVGPGYIGIATVGLRMHLESPNAYYIPSGLVNVYSHIYDRLTRWEEVQRDLDTAVIRYATAFNSLEKKTAALDLLFTIRHQLGISEALISKQNGLAVFLRCLDQFSAGEDVCEFKFDEMLEADGHTKPPQ